jgi:D-tagatose-bisphosphate aldolase class II non-catalytic subunit
MTELLLQLAPARQAGRPFGITSVCSAHPAVLKAALRRAKLNGRQVLIEATCNQVNQFGGYTGMTPLDFIAFVGGIAEEEKLNPSRIIFGGDHLGPNPWKNEPADIALAKAAQMVHDFVVAGFTKLHLDTSMACAGEPMNLGDALVAERAARLALVAEKAALSCGGPAPVYVLGTEVPIPGGADHALDIVMPTSAAAARSTIEIHREIFLKAGLEAAFSRVVAFVVQPGVEFGNANVISCRPDAAAELSQVIEELPQFVFEAHSTDYQTDEALASLVNDGYPILKVGPGLTFAYREALYGLDVIATELVTGYGNRPLVQTMESIMSTDPAHWQGHYHGDANALRVQRHYSYSDRIRYYWGQAEAVVAVNATLAALQGLEIPETLSRQFIPDFSKMLGQPLDAGAMLLRSVDLVLARYDRASGDQPGG